MCLSGVQYRAMIPLYMQCVCVSGAAAAARLRCAIVKVFGFGSGDFGNIADSCFRLLFLFRINKNSTLCIYVRGIQYITERQWIVNYLGFTFKAVVKLYSVHI